MASLFVTAPIWMTDEVIRALQPLGNLDTSIAVWISLLCLPLGMLLVVSGEPVLRSRHKHVGDFAQLDAELGPRMSTLAAVAIIIEHISTFALLSATMSFFIISAFPQYISQRIVFALVGAIAAVVSVAFDKRRYTKIASGLVLVTLTVLLVLIIGMIGASPYFLTTGSEDLANVSREVASRSDSAGRILIALFTALVTAMTPAILMRHLATDLAIYSKERARSATASMVALTFATGVVTVGVFTNVADIDSGAFLLREYTVFNALRIIHIPPVVLAGFGFLLFACTFFAARMVLDDAEKVAEELSNFSLLPLHISRVLSLTGSNTALLLVVAIGILLLSDGEFELIIPIVVASGLISLILSRLAAWLYWRRRLRHEGHSHERKTMKKAKLVALGGVIVSFIVLIAFLIADLKEGTWVAALAIGLLYIVIYMIRSHYLYYGGGAGEKTVSDPIVPGRVHYMVMASDLGPVVQRAVHWIQATRPYSLEVIHVDRGGDDTAQQIQRWQDLQLDVELTIIEATSIRVHQSVIDHIRRIRQDNPNRLINVVIPHVVFNYKIQNRVHNAELRQLRRALDKEPGVMVTLVPWSNDLNTSLEMGQ